MFNYAKGSTEQTVYTGIQEAGRGNHAEEKAELLSMSGQSLNVELQRQFHYEPAAATASAFVQQRRKLCLSAFEDILRRFTFRNRPKQQWNGYMTISRISFSWVSS